MVGKRFSTGSPSIEGLILAELKKLNKTLTLLTKEHIRHFDEWRTKNKGL
jgi:hypothetical protein